MVILGVTSMMGSQGQQGGGLYFVRNDKGAAWIGCSCIQSVFMSIVGDQVQALELLGKNQRYQQNIGITFIYLNHENFGYLSDKYPSIGYRCQASTKGRTQCRRLPALCEVWGRVVFKPQVLPTQMCRGWGSNPGPSGYRRQALPLHQARPSTQSQQQVEKHK